MHYRREGSPWVMGGRLAPWVRAILAAGCLLAPGCKRQDAAALFQGEYQIVRPAQPAYRATVAYDLSEYAAYDSVSFFADEAPTPFASPRRRDDPNWIDGAASGILEATMRRARQRGGAEKPDASLHLYSPSTYQEALPPGRLHLTYPPDGAAFPPNLCAPRIDWDDPANDLWQVTVGIADAELRWTAHTRERYWRLPPAVWDAVRRQAVERDAWIQVKGVRTDSSGAADRRRIEATPRVPFRVSRWPCDDFIVYRLVVPPFNKRKTPDTFCRDVRSHEVRPFLFARKKYCFNCHTFSSKAGDRGMLSVQARYMAPGSDLPVYVGIYDLEAQQGWKAKLPFGIQMSTFMSWSTDGRFLAFSANQQLVTFHPTVYETQFAGQPTSDLAVYDVQADLAYLLPGAADPGVLELLPRWSLDGQRIVYCAAPVGRHPAQTQYDLYEIPFHEGRGGQPEPVPGASRNGRSNFYPRFSPDGRWLSFCQADAGILIKSSSDLYLMPADLTGVPRHLECNAPYAADSWHSWSSEGRWLVFASKRDDGIFARLYMTRIADDGSASPAIRLPLEEEPLASFNIPEFVANPPRVDEADLFNAVDVRAAPHLVAEAAVAGP